MTAVAVTQLFKQELCQDCTKMRQLNRKAL